MDGTKMARIRRCHQCPHRSTRHADVRQWPHCDCGGGDVELSDELLEGPDANCPAGYWLGLAPVDLEAERMAQEEEALEGNRQLYKPILQAAMPYIAAEADKESFLVDAVAAGSVDHVVAQEVAVEEGLHLDAP